MAAAASMAVVGWWTGFKIGGLVSLSISDYFEKLDFITIGKLLLYFYFLFNTIKFIIINY